LAATGSIAAGGSLLYSNADPLSAERDREMSTVISYRVRGAIVAASLACVAALALTAPAFADEYSTSETTTTYQGAPPPPVAQTTTTTTTTRSDDSYSEGYVAEVPPPPPAPAPGITVGVPGVVGVHLGP
jgi:hypothetical protein